MPNLSLEAIVWNPVIYPRVEHWSSATIERYVDALESGAVFPPIVLEEHTNVLLDGKHRVEAYKKAGRTEIDVEFHTLPEGVSAKYYAATLSSRHGDRLSNASLKVLAEEEFQINPHQSAAAWARGLGITARTVQLWVKHITDPVEKERWATIMHLLQLGWTQEEVAAQLQVSQATVSLDIKERNFSFLNIPPEWNEPWLDQEAERLNVPVKLLWAAALQPLTDQERMKRLGITIQPYDVWTFGACHELFGSEWPGRIPGQLLAHVLYFFTDPGAMVIDPMAGSGTTVDVCLAMGRKCYAYDLPRENQRPDILPHDLLQDGWPERVKKADLIFWDPPYFDKKADLYAPGSISDLSIDAYLRFFAERFYEAYTAVKRGTLLAFLMSDWNDDTLAQELIALWHYAAAMEHGGWTLTRRIDCPLSTQQVHPDIVEKFRRSRRLARLNRSLLIGEKR